MAYFSATGTGGGDGGNEPVLLWTNPNPTSSFAAQTISIDTSIYKAIVIKAKFSTSNTKLGSLYLDADNIPEGTLTIETSLGLYRRTSCEYITNGVKITRAQDYSFQTANSYIIPLEIYGYREKQF